MVVVSDWMCDCCCHFAHIVHFSCNLFSFYLLIYYFHLFLSTFACIPFIQYSLTLFLLLTPQNASANIITNNTHHKLHKQQHTTQQTAATWSDTRRTIRTATRCTLCDSSRSWMNIANYETCRTAATSGPCANMCVSRVVCEQIGSVHVITFWCHLLHSPHTQHSRVSTITTIITAVTIIDTVVTDTHRHCVCTSRQQCINVTWRTVHTECSGVTNTLCQMSDTYNNTNTSTSADIKTLLDNNHKTHDISCWECDITKWMHYLEYTESERGGAEEDRRWAVCVYLLNISLCVCFGCLLLHATVCAVVCCETVYC
jgi:hypothetical protein